MAAQVFCGSAACSHVTVAPLPRVGAIDDAVAVDGVIDALGTSRSEGPSAKAWRSALKRLVKYAVVGSVLLSKSM